MKVTLDFAKEQRAEIVFPNVLENDSTIVFKYDISPLREGEVVNISLWGVNGIQKTELWHQYMFAQVPNKSNFSIKFNDLNKFDSFSLVAEKAGGLQFPHATLTLEMVPEPSSVLLLGLGTMVLAVSLIAKKIYNNH